MTIAITRRVCCGFALALAVHAAATAQTAPAPATTFAVLSLVGDQFTVVSRKDEVGSRLDQNARRSYKIDTAVLDEYALDAAEKTIGKLKPGASVLRFSIRDPRLFELQDKLLVDSGDSRGMREALAKLAREHQANRLVIVTKWRDDASFKLYSGTTGAGKISGLGFYLDPTTRMGRLDSGEEAFGFLAPYAYVSVALVDVASMKPIRSAPVRESVTSLPVHSKGAVVAWDALTVEEKLTALERNLRSAVETGTAAVLAD
jgi:hypothetical protein